MPTVRTRHHHADNDPLCFTDPLGLCRMTDVDFTLPGGYDDGTVGDVYVSRGPEGGLGLEQCQNHDDVRCSKHTAPNYTDAVVHCRPDTGGPFTGMNWPDCINLIQDDCEQWIKPPECPSELQWLVDFFSWGDVGRAIGYALAGDEDAALEALLGAEVQFGQFLGEEFIDQTKLALNRVVQYLGKASNAASLGLTIYDAYCMAAAL